MVTLEDSMFTQFVEKAKNIYTTNLKSVILYGSVARGDAKDDSDVDIALIVDSDDENMYDRLLDVVVDIELQKDIVISIVMIEMSQFQKWREVLPFYKNITKEGIALWMAA